jgi:hypothetical protein
MGDFSTSLLNELILKHIWPLILEIWLVAKILKFYMLCIFTTKHGRSWLMTTKICRLWYYEQKYDRDKLEKYRMEQLVKLYDSNAFDQETNMN